MARISNLPRRAMQRRKIPRNRASAGNHSQSVQKPCSQAQVGQNRADTTHNDAQDSVSEYSDGSEPESEDDHSDSIRKPSQNARPGSKKDQRNSLMSVDGSNEASDSELDSGSSSDSDLDSGYASAEEDPNEVAEYYNRLIDHYEAEGPTMANHDENTKKMTYPEEKRWNKFCKATKRDPIELLKACKVCIFKAYLHWRVKHFRIKKESSIMTYWNVISIVYAMKIARWMDGGVLYDISNWIYAKLMPKFDLNISKKEKSGLFIEDLDLILHHHYIYDDHVYIHERLYVQLVLILIIAGATTTRPDALIGNVLYKHIEFQLFPPGPGGNRSRLGLVVNLVKVKKSAGVSEKKIFGFHEEDTLLHDPILHMLSLVFADGAFLNDFSSPERIYEMVVPTHMDRVKIPWKEEWRGRPIFRDVDGLKVSLEKALKYCKTRGDLIRLGRALGYAKRLEFYDIRRGSGKKLHEKLTPEERNKAMGHRLEDSSTYVRYYMTDFIGADIQAITFGSDPQTDFVNLISRLVRHGNAPIKLTEDQKDEIANNPRLVKYLRKRSQAMARFKKQGYPTYIAAKKASVAKQYEKYRKRVESLRKMLLTKCLERAILEFHKTIHTKEID
ncbi:hypothetical protein BGZ63DRAFT_448187 [Mariannaea sp. PMI_226]|nr:hypothetical protein BGZ63DRAFT_448187 [Mariannaea sp. PMI_226]